MEVLPGWRALCAECGSMGDLNATTRCDREGKPRCDVVLALCDDAPDCILGRHRDRRFVGGDMSEQKTSSGTYPPDTGSGNRKLAPVGSDVVVVPPLAASDLHQQGLEFWAPLHR